MNGTVSSRLTLNGEGVTAKKLMLMSVQDKVGCHRLYCSTLIYQDLIDKLSSQYCGISISMESYNVFCYVDDVILTSLPVSGLQSLIDVSRDYITSHGLNFNSSKTTCTTFSTTHQVAKPTWILNEIKLKQDNTVTYLGTRLSNHAHDIIDDRITAARRAFYGLQGAGLCAKGANPFTIAHICSECTFNHCNHTPVYN